VITSLDEARAIADEALADGAPSWEVAAVRYGTRMTTRGAVYVEPDEPDAALGMDYFFWLLRGDAGTILVDTGFDPQVGERRGRTTLCPPVEALARFGVAPGSADLLVLTHLHYDHTGNVGRLAGTEIAAQTRELEFWTGEGTTPEHVVHVELAEIETIASSAGDRRLRRLDGGAALAPGVGAILVGGHSPGQMALIVKGRERPVLLTSDAVHYYEELERRLPFAIYVDLDEMAAGYDVLDGLAAHAGAVLVPGHDPEVMTRFPPASDELAGLAVRLG
jgi:glyoxylase-like metal-dependent hydrolase (beta-lactamase superfamily II)